MIYCLKEKTSEAGEEDKDFIFQDLHMTYGIDSIILHLLIHLLLQVEMSLKTNTFLSIMFFLKTSIHKASFESPIHPLTQKFLFQVLHSIILPLQKVEDPCMFQNQVHVFNTKCVVMNLRHNLHNVQDLIHTYQQQKIITT